ATAAPIRTPDPPLRNPTHAPASLSVRGRSQGCTSVVPPSESSSAPVLPTPEDDPSSGSGGAEVVASEELSSVDASVSDASVSLDDDASLVLPVDAAPVESS